MDSASTSPLILMPSCAEASCCAVTLLLCSDTPVVQEVLELSQGQVEDLMFLRRVYFLRRHELKTQRAALHLRTQEYDAEPIFAPSRVANVARQLHRNAVEDLQTMLRFSWTIYLGVGPHVAG